MQIQGLTNIGELGSHSGFLRHLFIYLIIIFGFPKGGWDYPLMFLYLLHLRGPHDLNGSTSSTKYNTHVCVRVYINCLLHISASLFLSSQTRRFARSSSTKDGNVGRASRPTGKESHSPQCILLSQSSNPLIKKRNINGEQLNKI